MITKVIKNTSSTIEIPIFFLLRVQAERNKRYFKLLRRCLSYAKRVQAERNKRYFWFASAIILPISYYLM